MAPVSLMKVRNDSSTITVTTAVKGRQVHYAQNESASLKRLPCGLQGWVQLEMDPIATLLQLEFDPFQRANAHSRTSLRRSSCYDGTGSVWSGLRGSRTGGTADLDPGHDPLADMDSLSRIWNPLKTSIVKP